MPPVLYPLPAGCKPYWMNRGQYRAIWALYSLTPLLRPHTPCAAFDEADAETALREGGRNPLWVPCHTPLFCRQSGQIAEGRHNDIQQLLGHKRPTTTDIYLRSVVPNLDRLAGIIEGAVPLVAPHGDEAEAEG